MTTSRLSDIPSSGHEKLTYSRSVPRSYRMRIR